MEIQTWYHEDQNDGMEDSFDKRIMDIEECITFLKSYIGRSK